MFCPVCGKQIRDDSRFCSGCDTGTNVFAKPGHYPGCGTYVTFSTTFGRIAGQNAAALEDWDA